MKYKTLTTRFLGNERGAVLPLIGLSILALILVAGIAIDTARYFLVRNKVYAALDSAVLGAANIATRNVFENDPGAIEERGRQFFRSNFPANYLGTTINDEDIEITFDPNTGRVNGRVDYDMDMVFEGIYDIFRDGQSITYGDELESEVLRTVGAVYEISFVMDYSYSMCFREGTGKPWNNARVIDSNCTKFENLERNVRDFVNEVESAIATSNDPESAAYYAFVPYSHTVVMNDVRNDMLYCFDDNKDKLPSATGLNTDPDAELDRIFGSDLSTEGGTNSAYGFWWGWAALRPDNNGLFTGVSAHENPSEHPAEIEQVENLDVSKLMIFLTDGANEYANRRCDNGNTIAGDSQGFIQDARSDARLADMCEDAKREGIIVATISYDVPANSPVADLLNDCATPGYSYNARDGAALDAAFDDIANRLIDLRITK